MRPQTKLVVALALLTTIALNAAQSNNSASVIFEAARKKEVVDGDPKAAIDLYKSIVSRFKNDRAIVADALLRMANCYQTFGDAEARRIYQRIVLEYPDQKDAVMLARTRLGVPTPETAKGISLRKVKDSGSQKISQDGRYVAGRFLYDLVTGIRQQWHEDENGAVFSPLISRGGSKIAYQACGNTCEFRVATATESGAYRSRRLFRYEGVRYRTRDWSPDGKQVIVTALLEDGTTRIGMFDVQNETLGILKSVDWRGADAIFFSPDGQDFAFDLPENDTSAERDIFLMATDGSRLIPAVRNAKDDALMGWSPDGKYLLFTSDRSGTNDLWALPFAGRSPQGNPVRLKPNVGEMVSLGVTKSGALYFTTPANERDIEFVSIDLNSGRAGMAVRPPQRYSGKNMEPAWSPDGKFLAYVSEREDDGIAGSIAIHSMDSNVVRELEPLLNFTWIRGLSWAPDGRSIAFTGVDLKARSGIFRLDVSSGKVSTIAIGIPLTYQGPFWSPDGQRIYYQANDGVIREIEIASGNERTVLPATLGGPISLSPDGRWIARYGRSTDGPRHSIVLVSTENGQTRELFRLPEGEFDNIPMPWTPDSRAVLVRKFRREGNVLWLAPIDGEAPRKLDVDLTQAISGQLGKIRLSPDGKHLAYVVGKSYRNETWVLENFLPSSTTSAREGN